MASQSGHCGNSPDTPADDASSEDGGTDWPTKSINMIVPMGAGGDTLTGIQWGKLPDTKGWIVPVCKG